MNRLLYEKSISTQGHLIIPFVFSKINGQEIYSYTLLSEIGNKGKFHKTNNPVGMYSETIDTILDMAKEHLKVHSDVVSYGDYFQSRYTYRDNLIIVHKEGAKVFYDHYPPEKLVNIAAPKIFNSEHECIQWIIKGLEQN